MLANAGEPKPPFRLHVDALLADESPVRGTLPPALLGGNLAKERRDAHSPGVQTAPGVRSWCDSACRPRLLGQVFGLSGDRKDCDVADTWRGEAADRLWNRIAPSPRKLLLMCLFAALLYGAANVGLCTIAGFETVGRRLSRLDWPYIAASLGGVAVALAGYRLAYEGISKVGGGPELTAAERWAAVIAGFGGFLSRGGASVDKFAMRAAGASERDAEVRVAGLDALEHAPLALGCCASAIYLLVTGRTDPPALDFVWPWAVAPPVGAAVAAFAATRYRDRFREAKGWRRWLGVALDAVWMLRQLVSEATGRGLPMVGMALFWAGEIYSLWAGMATFGYHMSVPSVILRDAVGYALSRRSAPFGGAGFIDLFLPLVLWDSGAPLAAAVAGCFVYRFFSLWLPLPATIAELPKLRTIGGGPSLGEPEPRVADNASC
ncbi:MAG: hypothetical protein JWM85_2057 [Acidimicrobiaceae bacterium]|nr:hypothetical protein [Acidimicrobiaceae bacterium]